MVFMHSATSATPYNSPVHPAVAPGMHPNTYYVERESDQRRPTQLHYPLPYANTGIYEYPVGMSFYHALDKTITDPFIPIRDVQNLHGIVRPRTKFIGKLLKLSNSLVWNNRTFTVDGQFLTCFQPERVGRIPPEHEPLSLPAPTSLVDTVLPDGDVFYRYTPKWIIPISTFRGIYVLESMGTRCPSYAATPQRMLSLAEDCVMGVQDPCEDLRWVNLLQMVAGNGKVQLEKMRCLSMASVQHTLLLVDGRSFYLLRAHTREELYVWMTVLCGKWVIWNQRWNYSSEECPMIYT